MGWKNKIGLLFSKPIILGDQSGARTQDLRIKSAKLYH